MNRNLKFRVWACNDKNPNGKMYYCGKDSPFVMNMNGDLVETFPRNSGYSSEYGMAWARIGNSNVTVQQFTGEVIKNGKELYEGDILKFTSVVVTKSFKNHDYKNPIVSEPVTDVKVGCIVFDKINDIDDFYSPYIIGWGIKWNGSDSISSLHQHLTDFGEKFSVIDSTYFKCLSRECEVVGNIFENPGMLKK